MNLETIKEEIVIIESYLSQEELSIDLLEVKNNKLIERLEKMGSREFPYEIAYEQKTYNILESSGLNYLWYKTINNVWVIDNYNIKRFFKN